MKRESSEERYADGDREAGEGVSKRCVRRLRYDRLMSPDGLPRRLVEQDGYWSLGGSLRTRTTVAAGRDHSRRRGGRGSAKASYRTALTSLNSLARRVVARAEVEPLADSSALARAPLPAGSCGLRAQAETSVVEGLQ